MEERTKEIQNIEYKFELSGRSFFVSENCIGLNDLLSDNLYNKISKPSDKMF